MSADLLRRAAAQMHESAEDNRCPCDEGRCEDNWYSNFLASVADWLDSVADDQNVDFDLINSEGYCALTVARAYLSDADV